MNLTRSFSVPAGIEQAWTAFNHLDRLEPCLPGVTLVGRAGDVYEGSVKIKFGPVALVYDGSSRYVERDIDASRLVLETQGEDRRGNGTATATTTLTFAENGEQTDVEVSAELELTGKPAQFGEEVIADTLSKLLDQFLSCVAGKFAEGIGDRAEEDEFGEDDPEDESDTEQTVEFEAVPEPVASEPVPGPAPATAGPSSAAGQPSVAPAAAAPQPSGSYRYTPPQDTSQPDVKVVATVASVMIKRYGPALGVVSLVVVIAVKVISRLRRR
jgi:carbon monoxide dehydrogenase subunit G